MGLYGAFVVHSGTPGTADGVAVDAEQTLVLSEVDTNFNADPLGFDMNNWHPQWWLVNGKSYPGTDTIDVTAGERVLLRWANAGSDNHTMSTLGLHQRLLARDGSLLPAPVDAVSETFPSGGTADGVVTVPAGAARGDRFPVYNRNMDLGQTFFLRLPTED
jgi:FtsP/CotA-like multicopper oxidase with cupredoxin domain